MSYDLNMTIATFPSLWELSADRLLNWCNDLNSFWFSLEKPVSQGMQMHLKLDFLQLQMRIFANDAETIFCHSLSLYSPSLYSSSPYSLSIVAFGRPM